MNSDSQKSSISDKVLKQIEKDQVKMRPKIYFILKALLIMSGIFIVALFVLYLVSFIVFALQASGAWYLSRFGFQGIKASIFLIPWLLIFVALFLVITLEALVKQFSFSYRRPILYSVLGIIIFVFLGSFAIGKTGLHPNLFQKAKEGRLPVAEEFYRGYGMGKFHNVHRGVVSELTNNGFSIKTCREEVLLVIVTPETLFLFEGNVEMYDGVIILGERDDHIITALGVRKINDKIGFLPKKHMPPRLYK